VVFVKKQHSTSFGQQLLGLTLDKTLIMIYSMWLHVIQVLY